MRFSLRAICCGLLLCSTLTFGQIPSRSDTTSTPVPNAGHDYIHAPVETVNPANGSLSIRIGVPVPPSRGFSVPFSFAYDSNGAFYLSSQQVNSAYWDTSKAILSQGGWSFSGPTLSVQKTNYTAEGTNYGTVNCAALINYVFQDASGDRRNLGLSYYGQVGSAPGGNGTECYTAGEELQTTGNDGAVMATTTSDWSTAHINPVTVTDGEGTTYDFPHIFPSPQLDHAGRPVCPQRTRPISSAIETAIRLV